MTNSTDGLAIICGRGDLPRLLAEKCKASGRKYLVVELANVPLDWKADHPFVSSAIETQSALFASLAAHGCGTLVLAGAMNRIPVDMAKLDEKGRELAFVLAQNIQAGDDQTLSAIIKFFETNGFAVLGAHDVLTSLIPNAGVLGTHQPSEADIADAARAAEIVEGLGRLDVGQAAVVGQGVCLATESIQGTDKMLAFVAANRDGYLSDPSGAKGVLLKAPKPEQDLRVDLPAIGPATIQNAFDAGLGGVVIEAGGVMVLSQDGGII